MHRTRWTVAVALGGLLALLPAARPHAAPAAGKPAPEVDEPPGVQIRFTVEPMMLCHYYLKTYSESSVKPRPGSEVDFVSEATAYAQARKLISDPGVWRWFEESIAASDDPAELRKATASLPGTLKGQDVGTAVNMLLDGMESAYPKYKETVYAREQNGVNRTFVGARKRYLGVEERILKALMGQMAFAPVLKPVKIFVVVRTGGQATWGTTEDFYFTVIGSFGQSPMSLLETGLHEATHIVDTLQPFRSGSVLARVRKEIEPAARQDAEVFLHGLVAFNAGELVKRFLGKNHTHAGVQAQGLVDSIRPYLSTYEYIWTDYLDGKMTVEGVAKKLVEEFEAVQQLKSKMGS